jgi:AcrR family transcriptional regulator
MSPRPNVSEERRSQIIESAIKVFAREGFANTRMDDVAAESGLSKGLLYFYFKSKEEIISAIADLLFGSELRKMQFLVDGASSAREGLEHFTEAFIADLRGMLKITPLFYEFYALAFRNATVRQLLAAYLRQFIAIIEPLVQRGIDRGEFAPGDARQITLTIGAVLEGTLLLWTYDSDMVPVEEQLRASLALLLKGLMVAK